MWKFGEPITQAEFMAVARGFTKRRRFNQPPHVMLATFHEFAPLMVGFLIDKERGLPCYISGEDGFTHTKSELI